MNKKLLIAALSGAVAFSAQASDVTGVYLQGKLGSSIQHQSSRHISAGYTDYDNQDYNIPAQRLSIGTKTKAVFAGGVAAGFDFNPQFNVPLRLELEYIARANGSSSGGSRSVSYNEPDSDDVYTLSNGKTRVSTQTWMVNGYYDIDTATPFRPYLSLGVGLAHNRLKGNGTLNGYDKETKDVYPSERGSISKSKARFAWSMGAGLAYDIDKNWSVDLAYRFVDAGRVSGTKTWYGDDEAIYAKVRYHDILVGVRYTF